MAALLLSPSWVLRHVTLPYFTTIFKKRTAAYIDALIAKEKPKHVFVCMIYYPDENSMERSWAGDMLAKIGYNANPQKLQLIIRRLYETATSKVRIKGVNVQPVPLHRVLNGKYSSDYTDRVEPSEKGGRKMADHFNHRIRNLLESE